ncbi:hypothetical protein MMC07_007765 [Pseudocyphellaria aurata]|nr:hypothetical protein [Pseudocyphellaria aurata]
MAFNATDHPAGGIHYETVRIACGIIAGNRWDGYFTEEVDGTKLEFTGNPSPFKYPIVPTFAEWVFPHNHLPSFWAAKDSRTWPSISPAASVASRVNSRDQTCRISDAEEACEMAHMIPAQEQAWFNKNVMWRYSDRELQNIGTVNNMMRLRKDLHSLFDARKPVFVLKASSSHSNAANWVVHTMEYSKDLQALYHNRPLHDITSISREFLFARFAWTLFPKMEGFLRSNVERLLISASSAGEAFIAPADKCKTFLPTPKSTSSRSQSPTERARMAKGQDFDRNIKPERLDLGTAPSVPTLPGSSPHTFPRTALDLEDAALEKLVQESLRKERLRSDPEGTWVAELDWMHEQDMGTPMSPNTFKRWYIAQGLDDIEEYDI